MTKKFYVTTAIDYVNAEPHIGHAYQKIVADVIARWNSKNGSEVLFVTGTDEYGKKVKEASKKVGKNPKDFVDEISEKFKEAWKDLDISYTRFIRTTDKDHHEVVIDFIKKCEETGDIYLGEYEGLYCVGCEAYYTEKDCPDGKCLLHNRPLEKIKEKSYFFRLSKYQDFLLDLYDKHPEFILPKSRRNEIINRVKCGLNDLSITRTSFNWGIPFPLDKSHVTYVWFDALINYYTATREKGREDFWPADVHLLGKDNTWFHTVYWPAMLKSAGIKLPKTTFNHGFISFNGQKISKSLGNAISPRTLVSKYGSDSVRYFCLRQFAFAEGNDGDFNESALIQRHNDELANKLGNLVSRVSSLVEKQGIEKTTNKLIKELDKKKIDKLFSEFAFDKVLNEIFSFIDICNEYIQNKKPWETPDKKVLYELVESIKVIGELLEPFIPKSAKKIFEVFSGEKIKKAPVLFEKIEFVSDLKQNINKDVEIDEIMEGVAQIGFEDFEKLDLRVSEIEQVEEIPGADKLYKLNINTGLDNRTICAGIKEFYSHDDLRGKKIIVLTNLKPKKLKGIESHGMLLAAANLDHTRLSLLCPDSDMEVGARVG